jgi:hypothetical protein
MQKGALWARAQGAQQRLERRLHSFDPDAEWDEEHEAQQALQDFGAR